MTQAVDASVLSAVLWRERQLLDLLAFKLEEEQLVIGAARHHIVGQATAEVEQVLAQVRDCETERTEAVATLATDSGLDASLPLRELIGLVDEPWSALLEEHRSALREAVIRISFIASATRRLLAGHLAASADALSLLGAAPPAYARGGAVAAPSVPARGRLVRGTM